MQGEDRGGGEASRRGLHHDVGREQHGEHVNPRRVEDDLKGTHFQRKIILTFSRREMSIK